MNDFVYFFSILSLPLTGFNISCVLPLTGTSTVTFVMSSGTESMRKAIFEFSDAPGEYVTLQPDFLYNGGIKGMSVSHLFTSDILNQKTYTVTASCFRLNLVQDIITFSVVVTSPTIMSLGGLAVASTAIFSTPLVSDNVLIVVDTASQQSTSCFMLSGKQITA